jgi:hypothetical protein
MIMTPRTRRFALTVHIIFSVGWLGAVVAYLSLVVALFTGGDAQTARSAWTSMELIGWFVIIPLAIGALLSGLVMSLGTTWGLFRHYWVVIKLVLTAFATVILIVHMPTVSLQVGEIESVGHVALGGPRGELVHAGGGLLVLLVTTILAVYKPWGLTTYGRRKRQSN